MADTINSSEERKMAEPEGFNTITPLLIVKNAGKAIELYEKALGAETVMRLDSPDGSSVLHAVLQIGSSKIFLGDEHNQMTAPSDGAGTRLYLYVDDVDAQHATAIGAGMTEKHALEDMFWGDRTTVLNCPHGHTGTLATHQRDVTPEEIAEAMTSMAS
jgi:PhnB protein